ncbi:hypothetical protein [Corynebacterium ulcerans]|uniref:hypothetical protein n=1 Tax=Corynebacterium ulcerans TaxID=65058 RepID=UPI0011AEFBEA|nr:hypothetical protein [Corynebacterium ulcerans]
MTHMIAPLSPKYLPYTTILSSASPAGPGERLVDGMIPEHLPRMLTISGAATVWWTEPTGTRTPSTPPGAPKSSTPTCGTVTRGEMTGDEAVAEIRDNRRVVNKAVYMAVGVDMEFWLYRCS